MFSFVVHYTNNPTCIFACGVSTVPCSSSFIFSQQFMLYTPLNRYENSCKICREPSLYRMTKLQELSQQVTLICEDIIRTNSKGQVASNDKPEANPIPTNVMSRIKYGSQLCTAHGWEKVSSKP